MRPVLQAATGGEIRISEVVDRLADELGLPDSARAELLPSGKQTVFANRVHWAKTYLKQAGLVRATKRGHFVLTDRGREALAQTEVPIDNAYLQQFEEFQEFKKRTKTTRDDADELAKDDGNNDTTPDEALRQAYTKIHAALATDLLERIRESSPAFFEKLIVELLLAMGYGGTSEDAGRALGQSGDGGIDGVIDQDPLGVDQVYVQAKRYGAGNPVGAGAIRDFYGALSLKRAHKGIFVTTSTFSFAAVETAANLGSRIVLIDGEQLARLMIRYNIGCREEEALYLKKIDEDFFESQ